MISTALARGPTWATMTSTALACGQALIKGTYKYGGWVVNRVIYTPIQLLVNNPPPPPPTWCCHFVTADTPILTLGNFSQGTYKYTRELITLENASPVLVCHISASGYPHCALTSGTVPLPSCLTGFSSTSS